MPATDWERIAALYVVLGHLTPSPVIELNRAVAVGMAYGPARGLGLADQLAGVPALTAYAHLPAVRGDLLARLGRLDEARAEFERAAALTANQRERALFQARAAACAASARLGELTCELPPVLRVACRGVEPCRSPRPGPADQRRRQPRPRRARPRRVAAARGLPVQACAPECALATRTPSPCCSPSMRRRCTATPPG